MSDAIVVALISGVATLVGVVIRQLSVLRAADRDEYNDMRDANADAHSSVREAMTGLSADLHEHRVVTESKLDGLDRRVTDIHEQAEEREKYWRDRGETFTERVARLEEQNKRPKT